ncbi:MAG: hypothetical protein DRG27_06145 [Deltaproteobacteria bacterium]|nr:MAG: hypothetical protein DRG27_06145 [Deltaproteobacteria bacterium]
MHLKRWLTAFVLLPLTIYVIGFSPSWAFYVFLIFFLFLALKEFYSITSISFVPKFSGYISSLLLLLTILMGQMYFFPLSVFFAVLLCLSFAIVLNYSPSKEVIQDIGASVLSVVYIAIPFSLIMVIYRHPFGKAWILFLLCVVIAGDTGAFYFGRYLGRHKLHKKVSPNKTWEGAVGGLFCSTVAGLMFIRAFKISSFSYKTICFLIFISMVAQMGDLAESFIKRSFGKKDSGSILPGHGGVLDRIDSLLFAIPFLYGYIMGR